MTFKVPNRFRIKTGPYGSTDKIGNQGAFSIRFKKAPTIHVIASEGEGWEHVSVSLPGQARCPTWGEMCQIKALFWDDEDLVIQYHPPQSDYVNNHPYTLHLWRKYKTNDFVELPPSWMV